MLKHDQTPTLNEAQPKRLNRRKWRNIIMLVTAMSAVSTLTFNCAPSMFQVSSLTSSSSSLGVDAFTKPQVSPVTLMSARQTYKTFLNVTGQEGAQTTAQLNEYESRANSLATNDRLSNINAPLQLAATSVAGEVCAGLLTKESGLVDSARKFLVGIDITKALAADAPELYQAAVGKMAVSFWGRQLTAAEGKLMSDFYTEFTSGSAASAATTRALYLATCTGMLASLDSYTY